MRVPPTIRKRLILALVLACSVLGEERIDQETNAKILAEATGRSQLMRTVHVLADRYGPRLTGSPNYADAANWVAGQLTRGDSKAFTRSHSTWGTRAGRTNTLTVT